MNEEDITFESLSGESQLNSADDKDTVGNVADNGNGSQAESMTLSELNQFLGKNFGDKATALKSLKDTFSYVGKKKEDIEKEVKSNLDTSSKIDTLARELEVERKERFYDRNPQYAEASVRKLIEKIGGNPAEVVNSEEFKTIFTKVADYDKSQNLKTVLESNPRLASTKDSFSKAHDILRTSNNLSADKPVVDELAVKGVMDAYEMN